MIRFPFFWLLFLLPVLATAQEKRVYTVAGRLTLPYVIDGNPATSGALSSTEGIWIDGNCNLYISEVGLSRVRKVSLTTGTITTLAGKGDGTAGSYGFGGDGGPATNALINGPYGLYSDSAGNVYFADGRNDRIRRVDAATGIITTFAGGGTSVGDGGPATNAQLYQPGYVFGFDTCIYIGEKGRIRKVSTVSGIITTIAGTGIWGLSGDGGLAINAQVNGPASMVMDTAGNLLFADRANALIRKISTTSGIITTIAGSTPGDSGDGGPATNAQLGYPISIAIDEEGNLIIGDNTSNRIKVVNSVSGIITSVAGVGSSSAGSNAEGVLATLAEMHPEFIYLDRSGNLFYSNFGPQVRRITGFKPGLAAAGSTCSILNTNDIEGKKQAVCIYPNPTDDEITVSISANKFETIQVYNSMGQLLLTKSISSQSESIDVSGYVSGFYYLILKGTQGTKTLSFTKN